MMIPQVARIQHEVEADIINIYFGTLAVAAYVHYYDEFWGTLHDMNTDEIVGIHIEGWTHFNAKIIESVIARKAEIEAWDKDQKA